MAKNDSRMFGNLVRVVMLALVAAAIYKEMRKPPEEREWHGRLANLIPYDFRFPTVERVRERMWNPDDPRIFTEHVFGVGWVINFHTLLDRLQMLSKEAETEAVQEADDLPDEIP